MSFQSSTQSKGKSGRVSANLRDTSKAVKGFFGDEEAHCDEVIKGLKGKEVEARWLGIFGSPIAAKSSLDHNYLMIDVVCVVNGKITEKRPGYIKAEKGVENSRGKIRVSECEKCSEDEEKHRITLKGCGNIQGEKLLEVLTKYHSSFYSLLKHNCWKYADAVYRMLIYEFANLPDTDDSNKKRLKKYLADLPPLRLPSDALIWAEKSREVFIALCTAITGVVLYHGLTLIIGTPISVMFPVFLFVGVSFVVLSYYGTRFFFDFLEGMKPGRKKDFSFKKSWHKFILRTYLRWKGANKPPTISP